MKLLLLACALVHHLAIGPALASPTSAAAGNPRWTVGQVVNTTTGRFQGHPAYNRTEVSAYLGIPFAQPPVGHLRFAAPQKLEVSGNDVVVNAQRYGFNCPQANTPKPQFAGESPDGTEILNHNVGVHQTDSEDCLTLNIWTKPQSGERKKAILMFIYGGAFSSGRSNNQATNGQYFADEEDVVMVTFNYRVGVFGFLGLPGHEQNAGLLDQRAAVEWVRDNAEAFGGDPARITLVGQSAGATSVDLYSYAWTKDPIVSGFIEESGTATSFGDPLPNSEKYWHQLVSALNCGGHHQSRSEAMACVRGKTWQEVIAATPPGQLISAFAPTIDNKVVFANYPQRAAKGQFIKKAYLLGSNNNEEAYFNATSGGAIDAAAGQLINTQYFNCPTAANVRARAAASPLVPTYRYRYFGDFPNLQLYSGSGAYHTSEISVIFGTSARYSGSPSTALQEHWSRKMRRLWAGFAKDPVGVQTMGLRQYEPLGKTLNVLARGSEKHPSYDAESAYDAGCPVVKSSR